MSPTNYTTGIPHSAMKDDVYNGLFIPKGSIMIANIWYARLYFPDGLPNPLYPR